jgi:putative RNA 2'-phosphotransferase
LGKNHQFKVRDLSRLLVYLLGRRPDEFGLLPDKEGFVRYKELLKALHEESGWRYVRRSHINEVLLSEDRPLFQADADRIRSVERRWDWNLENPAPEIPKLLFTPVRLKAHPVVMEKGLQRRPENPLILTPDKEMAQRIGTRRDAKPVLVEVAAYEAAQEGFPFYSFGSLFLSRHIPAKFLLGPPVAEELQEARQAKQSKKPPPRQLPHKEAAGSFSLDLARDPDPRRRPKGRKRKGWKEEARKLRRKKRR